MLRWWAGSLVLGLQQHDRIARFMAHNKANSLWLSVKTFQVQSKPVSSVTKQNDHCTANPPQLYLLWIAVCPYLLRCIEVGIQAAAWPWQETSHFSHPQCPADLVLHFRMQKLPLYVSTPMSACSQRWPSDEVRDKTVFHQKTECTGAAHCCAQPTYVDEFHEWCIRKPSRVTKDNRSCQVMPVKTVGLQ